MILQVIAKLQIPVLNSLCSNVSFGFDINLGNVRRTLCSLPLNLFANGNKETRKAQRYCIRTIRIRTLYKLQVRTDIM